MTDVTPEAYASHVRSLVMLLAQTLSSLQNLGNLAALHILNILRHLIPVAKHDETVGIICAVFAKFINHMWDENRESNSGSTDYELAASTRSQPNFDYYKIMINEYVIPDSAYLCFNDAAHNGHDSDFI